MKLPPHVVALCRQPPGPAILKLTPIPPEFLNTYFVEAVPAILKRQASRSERSDRQRRTEGAGLISFALTQKRLQRTNFQIELLCTSQMFRTVYNDNQTIRCWDLFETLTSYMGPVENPECRADCVGIQQGRWKFLESQPDDSQNKLQRQLESGQIILKHWIIQVAGRKKPKGLLLREVWFFTVEFTAGHVMKAKITRYMVHFKLCKKQTTDSKPLERYQNIFGHIAAMSMQIASLHINHKLPNLMKNLGAIMNWDQSETAQIPTTVQFSTLRFFYNRNDRLERGHCLLA